MEQKERNNKATGDAGARVPAVIPDSANAPHEIQIGFDSEAAFAHIQRVATAFASSTIVPAQFRGEKNIGNVIIALDMANRMRSNPLAVMQNIQIIKGKPGWSSQWIIGAINSTGKFSPLRFELSDPEPESEVTATLTEYDDKGNKKTRAVKERICNRTCVAWAVEKATGDRIESPVVSMVMAVKEGWYSRNASKWQTMPDLMLRYRSAAFFGRLYAPELLFGMPTAEEILDVPPSPDDAGAPGAIRLTPGRHDHSRKTLKDESEKPEEKKAETAPPAAAAGTPPVELKVIVPKTQGRDDIGFATTKMLIMLAGGDKAKGKAMLAVYCKSCGFEGIKSFSEMAAAQALLVYTAVVEDLKKKMA